MASSRHGETVVETGDAGGRQLELLERTVVMLQRELEEKDAQIARWESEAASWKDAFLKEKETSQAAQPRRRGFFSRLFG